MQIMPSTLGIKISRLLKHKLHNEFVNYIFQSVNETGNKVDCFCLENSQAAEVLNSGRQAVPGFTNALSKKTRRVNPAVLSKQF